MSRSRLWWWRNVVVLGTLALTISPAAAQQVEPTKLYETFKKGLDSSLVENDPKARYQILRNAQRALWKIEEDFPNSAEAVMVRLGDTSEVSEALARTEEELSERLLSFLDEHPISVAEGIGGVRPGQAISALSPLEALLPRVGYVINGIRRTQFISGNVHFIVDVPSNKKVISTVRLQSDFVGPTWTEKVEGIRAKLRRLPEFAKKLSLFLTYDEVIAVLGPPTTERLGQCGQEAGKANRYLFYPQLSVRVCKVVVGIEIDG